MIRSPHTRPVLKQRFLAVVIPKDLTLSARLNGRRWHLGMHPLRQESL